jgi:hypothetical protein
MYKRQIEGVDSMVRRVLGAPAWNEPAARHFVTGQLTFYLKGKFFNKEYLRPRRRWGNMQIGWGAFNEIY